MELEEIAEPLSAIEEWLPEPEGYDPAPAWVDAYEC